VSFPFHRPRFAEPLIRHLATWGEVSISEMHQIEDSELAVTTLSHAGLVDSICIGEKVPAWSLTSGGTTLLDRDQSSAYKVAGFQVPRYREYLLGILAEGMVTAARAGMQDRVEGWTGGELLSLLTELNGVLDLLEVRGVRLVDLDLEEIHSQFAAQTNRSDNFTAWDQLFLGHTSRPDDLFEFVLRRFAPLATLPTSGGATATVAVLRTIPLNTDDGFSSTILSRAEPWSVRRFRIQGSVPLFDELGHPLFDRTTSTALVQSLQDALLVQPFYQTVVQLAVCAWRSPATSLPTVELQVPTGVEPSDVMVIVGGRDAGRLRDILCELVVVFGVRPRGLKDGLVPADLMANVLRNLTATEILMAVEDRLELHPEFKSSLMGRRLRTLFRPGKVLQADMLQILSGLQANTKAEVG
jgi:hypothetical protein